MVSHAGSGKASVRPATACTECHRRKQKCSREWPCNHCQARQIAHLCKYTPKRVVKAAKSTTKYIRESESPKNSILNSDHKSLRGINPTLVSNYDDFRALGYLPDIQDTADDGVGSKKLTAISSDSQGILSSEMKNALHTIPPKPYTDILVQHFLNNTNYNYYPLYPPAFLSDYSNWWSRKAVGLPLTLEFTCLLLRVCACSAPYLDEEIRQKLESELGESIEHLSRLYHNTARQLSGTISPGKGGLTQVQQLFLTAQWFKTEALFIESWHALGVAIHEAQELGMHRGSSNAKISEFDREMRRRLWCILYAWDWQMSLLLSRPFIIHSGCSSFELPNMRLENVDFHPECPSPITHMVLQCQLGLSISKIPGVMGGVISPAQAMSIQQEIEKWSGTFPSAYSLPNPDTRWDDSHHFIKLQRHTLNAIGHMVLLRPLKQCLTKHIDSDGSSIEKSLQSNAVECALKLIKACNELLEYLLPSDSKFHFAPFLIFDTAALLCSALMHEKRQSLPQRESVIEAISKALDLLGQLSERVKTGAICYTILNKLIAGLPALSSETASTSSKSPQSSIRAPQTLPDLSGIHDPSSCFSVTAPLNTFDPEFCTSMPPNFYSSGPMIGGQNELLDISQVDLGELSQIWDWENLDLNFSNPGFF